MQSLGWGYQSEKAFSLYQPGAEGLYELSESDRKILWALNQVEASGRMRAPSRHEPLFYERYLKNDKRFDSAEKRYGKVAISSSYGPWQIMYATAYFYGYRGRPEDLSRPEVSLVYVMRYLDELRVRFNDNIEKVISAYNAGPGGVGTNPGYTNKVLARLKQAPDTWSVPS